MKRALAVVLLLAAVGCRDEKQPTVASVVVDPGEQTLLVRQTVQLQAVARDEEGAEPAGTRFTWRALDSRVATVDGEGMVTAVATGSTGVVASYRDRADTARIDVISAVADCADPAARIRLGVGEASVMRGAAAATLCLDGGADYTLVGFLGSRAPSTRTVLEVRAVGAAPVSATPSPSREPGLAEQLMIHRDDRFHARINQRAARELLPLVPEARAVLGPRREGGASRQMTAAPPSRRGPSTARASGTSGRSSRAARWLMRAWKRSSR
ncbi:MAG TPA: Ig-like domain-containing protein [Longimicrobium sp.]|nr:Ig-like domain-containing protein [Longimicrobium sp.]